MPISSDVFVLSARDLDQREQHAYRRGLERGKFEERAASGKEPVALNCAHWRNGTCETCGAQHQGFDVDALFKCPHFRSRS